MLAWCVSSAGRAVRYGCGFFEIHAPQSMTRAVALLCGLAGARLALAAAAVSQRPHLTTVHADVIKALALAATGFVGGGAVALLARSRAQALSAAPSPAPGAS